MTFGPGLPLPFKSPNQQNLLESSVIMFWIGSMTWIISPPITYRSKEVEEPLIIWFRKMRRPEEFKKIEIFQV